MSIDELINLGVARELIVMIISALPIFELRGAIPVAINVFHFSWYYALFLAIIGNMLPIPFILLFLDVFVKVLRKIKWTSGLVDWVFNSTWRKVGMIQRYKHIGLAIFVGIPLPFTGACTQVPLQQLSWEFPSSVLSSRYSLVSLLRESLSPPFH